MSNCGEKKTTLDNSFKAHKMVLTNQNVSVIIMDKGPNFPVQDKDYWIRQEKTPILDLQSPGGNEALL